MVNTAGSWSPHSPAFGSQLCVSLAEAAPVSEPYFHSQNNGRHRPTSHLLGSQGKHPWRAGSTVNSSYNLASDICVPPSTLYILYHR